MPDLICNADTTLYNKKALMNYLLNWHGTASCSSVSFHLPLDLMTQYFYLANVIMFRKPSTEVRIKSPGLLHYSTRASDVALSGQL